MSDKYIIKNCPNYRDREVDYTCTIEAISSDCHNCTDCVMKQIVELCNKIIFLNGGTDFTDVDMYKHAVGENCVARQVLQLLQIEEVK